MSVTIVNVHEAKTHLSRLLIRVAAGEEIVIARAGRAVARLVPLERGKRRPGRLKGRLSIGRDFDAPLPEAVLAGFEGKRR
jgi:prevent-host-death family protein